MDDVIKVEYCDLHRKPYDWSGNCPLCSYVKVTGAVPVPLTKGGIKHDQDKSRVDLLDPVALDGLADVLAFGAAKYSAHNWRGGISYTRLIGAALRHLFAILRGEDTDPESGLPHVDHLGCCWMFLSWHMKTRSDMDDRWKSPHQG